MKWIKMIFDWLGKGRAKGEGRSILDKVEPQIQDWAIQKARAGRKVKRMVWPMNDYVYWDGNYNRYFRHRGGQTDDEIYYPDDDEAGQVAADWILYP